MAEREPYFPIVPELYDKVVEHYERGFLPVVSEIERALSEEVEPLRRILLDREKIKRADVQPSSATTGGVDGSSVLIEAGGLVTVISVGICVRSSGPPLYRPQFASTAENDLVHMVGVGARVLGELQALAASEDEIVFVDGSLGAMARDVNTFLRGFNEDGAPLERIDEAVRVKDDLIAGRGCALTALLERAGAFLMFPKRPMGTSLADDLGLSSPVPDALLANAVLHDGEVLGPFPGYRRERSGQRTLRLGGEDFRRLGLSGDVERDLESMFRRLSYVFYKPHPWSRAFRLEYVADAATSGRAAMILSSVARETATPGYVEPIPIFMADALAKQAAQLGSMFGAVNVGLHPSLMQETRSLRA